MERTSTPIPRVDKYDGAILMNAASVRGGCGKRSRPDGQTDGFEALGLERCDDGVGAAVALG